MKISVVGYNTFKDVVTDIGGLTNLYYCQSLGTVFKILGILSSGIYVQADLSTGGAPVVNLTTDFPIAIEAPINVEGEF